VRKLAAAGLMALAAVALTGCPGGRQPEKAKAGAAKAPARPPEVYRVRIETTKGELVVEVQRAWAPRGADHFYDLVESRFYDGVRFHRVLRGFVCQFGINGNPRINGIWNAARIPDDPVKQKNRQGTLAYAKIGPNSRTTQVFNNLRDNPELDKTGFAPFGRVVEGFPTVERLYSSYGEGPPRGTGPDPAQLELKGEPYLEAHFARLDRIRRAVVLPVVAAAAPASAPR
jgi:peptidyl-prolyl cis-trans isomerase A (cyclophilin A)